MTEKLYKIKADEFIDLVPSMGGCFATDKITVAGMKVGDMYREEPDDTAVGVSFQEQKTRHMLTIQTIS